MKIEMLRFHFVRHAKRIGQAWRLARGRLTREDARALLWEMEQLAGWHSLETVSIEDVVDAARNRWADHPKIKQYAQDATARVASKWSSSGDIPSAAIDQAIDLIAYYADLDGVKLVELDEAQASEVEEA